jgi:DNA-binding LacI/PurR family transcriptional regulator
MPLIDKGGSGRGRVTLADVAARAGVSRALASLVIRDAPGASAASRAAVLQAAAELGYRPDPAAQLLRQHRSRLIGVLFDPGDPFHADLLEQLYVAVERSGYEVVLAARVPSRSEQRAVDSLVASRCEGLVLIGTEAPTALLRAARERLPVTVVGRPGDKGGVDAVRVADEAGAAAAVDFLIELGHRRIRHVDGGRHAGATERRRGYRATMRRHGLMVDITPGDNTEESGVRAARDLLAGPGDVTAVFAGNDRCAVGVLDTLLRAGVDVPADISVMGYDDSRLARLTHTNLTTVAQDPAEMARLAVESVVSRLDGDPDAPPRDLALEPRLVVRTTTGPAPTRAGPDRPTGADRAGHPVRDLRQHELPDVSRPQ